MTRFRDDPKCYESRVPVGTRIRVQQFIDHRSDRIESDVTGVVESWDQLTTRSWHAHGVGGRLPLIRLKLRKDDGELTLLVVDQHVVITPLDEVPAGG
jgi:hypothetical protein